MEAMLLRPHSITVGRSPRTQRRERGYRRTGFEEEFGRYLTEAAASPDHDEGALAPEAADVSARDS